MREVSPAELARILGRGKEVKTGDGWKTLCPSHVDNNPSMTIFKGANDGRWMVNCQAGCDPRTIYAAIEAQGYQLEGRGAPSNRTSSQLVSVIPAPQPYPDSVQHRTLGKPTEEYVYKTAEGEVAFVVHRWSNRTPKVIRPFSCLRDKQGIVKWDWKLHVRGKRPLYNLDKLTNRPDDVVLLVEGEKAARAAEKLFPEYVVSTWSGGAKNWKHTDFSPLKGRRVLIWPDHDEEGRAGANSLATNLITGDFCEWVKVGLVPASWPNKWDLADPVPEGSSLAEVSWQEAFKPSRSHTFDQIDHHNYQEVLDSIYWLYDDGDTVMTVEKVARDRVSGSPFSNRMRGAFRKINATHPAKGLKRVARPEGSGMEYPLYLWRDAKSVEDRVHGLVFDPTTTEPVVHQGGYNMLNVFTGFGVEPSMEHTCDLFKQYVWEVLAGGDKSTHDYIWNYLSHMFQYPGEKPPTCLIFRGKQGTGKSTLGRVLSGLMGGFDGYLYNVSSMSRLAESFNGSLIEGRLCVFIEEIEVTQSRSLINKLKSFISDPAIEVNQKYRAQYVTQNLTRVIGATNHSFAMSMDTSDRRFSFIDVSDCRQNDVEFFGALHKELNRGGYRRLMWELLEWDVDKSRVHYPLETQARAEQKFHTGTPAQDLVYRLLSAGEIQLEIYNERTRTVEGTFYRDREEWTKYEQFLPSKFVNDELRRMKDSSKYPEKYSPRDPRGNFSGVLDLLHPAGEVPTKWTTIRISHRGVNQPTNGKTIPPLEQARKNFADHVGISYEELFQEPTNVVEFPDKKEAAGEVPF